MDETTGNNRTKLFHWFEFIRTRFFNFFQGFEFSRILLFWNNLSAKLAEKCFEREIQKMCYQATLSKNNQNKSQFPEFPRIRQLSWFFILAKRVQIFRFVDFISFCLCKKYFVGWTVKSFVIFRVIFCFNLQRIVNSTTTLFSYLVNIRSNLSK